MKLTAGVLTVAALVACSDSFSPTTENVAGAYRLLRLVAINGGHVTDWGRRGATFTITLAPNGTTTGRLFIPGADESGADFDVDMAGTWSLSGDTVRFTQTADSFVRDMIFIAHEDWLGGDYTVGDDRVIAAVAKR